MIKYILLISLLFSSLFANELKIYTNFDLAIKEAKIQKKDIFIFFYGNYCSYCDKMKKTTLKNNNVIKFINDRFIFLSLNEDDNPNKDKYILDYIPASYILEPLTKKIKYFTYGYRSSEDFIGEFTQNIK